MPNYTDQMGRKVQLFAPPERIISLVPSQTELLHAIGLGEEVVGITKFCVHPKAWWKSKERIGGTKKLNLEKIRELDPDLIIGNKEENTKEDIEELEKEFPVWVSDVDTLDDAYEMMVEIGRMCDHEKEAVQLAKEIEEKFKSLPVVENPEATVAYFIWENPKMVVSNDTFVDHLLNRCGFKNVFSNHPKFEGERYPEVTKEDLKSANPDFVFLSSEPFPFKDEHKNEFREILPQSRVEIVDGEMFSWYGSRLLQAVDYLKEIKNS